MIDEGDGDEDEGDEDEVQGASADLGGKCSSLSVTTHSCVTRPPSRHSSCLVSLL